MAKKIDIDAMAAAAKREITHPRADYVKDPGLLPIQPFTWHLIIQPMKPKTISGGGLYIPEQAQEAAEMQITIGTVVAVGPLAFTGVSKAGVDLSKFSDTYKSARQLLGVKVIHQRYTGLTVKLKTGDKLLILEDSNIVGVVDNTEEIFFHYD